MRSGIGVLKLIIRDSITLSSRAPESIPDLVPPKREEQATDQN
jgi:hypothetical protein